MGNCCMRIIYPVKVRSLVISRLVSFLLLLINMVILTLSMIMRSWKIESYKDDTMEIGLWTICRYATRGDRELYFNKCFDSYYSEQPYVAWFECWRFFLVTADVILFITFNSIIIQQIYKKDHEKKHWVCGAIACLVSAFFIATSLVLYWDRFPFEFIEESFRWANLGWTEVTADRDGFYEGIGTPVIMCTVTFFLSLITSYSCYVTRYCENRYIIQTYKDKLSNTLLMKGQNFA